MHDRVHFNVLFAQTCRFFNVFNCLCDFIPLKRKLAAVFLREGFQRSGLKRNIRGFLLRKQLQLVNLGIWVKSLEEIDMLVQQFF